MSHEDTEYRPFSQDFQLWMPCRFGREFEVSLHESRSVSFVLIICLDGLLIDMTSKVPNSSTKPSAGASFPFGC